MNRRRVNTQSRRKPSREPRIRLLVVCGGRRTEPAYLYGLRHDNRNPAVIVKVATCPQDPYRVIEYAKKLRTQGGEDFDQVWCVLDVDQFDYTRALATAKRDNINLAISNPCFETWLLLHHVDLTASVRDAGAAVELLRQVIPGYDKAALDFSDFAGSVTLAVKRAKRLSSDESPLGGNPSSGMWRLAEIIIAP